MACYKAANLRWPCYHHFRSLDIGANCSSHSPLQPSELPEEQQQQQQQQTSSQEPTSTTGPCGTAASTNQPPVVCKRCKKYLSLLKVLRQTRDCSNGIANGYGCCHTGCCSDDRCGRRSAVEQGDRQPELTANDAGGASSGFGTGKLQNRCSFCCGCCPSDGDTSTSSRLGSAQSCATHNQTAVHGSNRSAEPRRQTGCRIM
ncbi:hypothetical protein BOX15_Mlig020139g1 [Macrostomum lignano]|uniref:Uncharacterized protein n=1 Tax=Macrostomum lignano TaxID=282301 RepID=A0A267DS10_9PLAT|nr:hypothetical protein BOX15_Mlig020139g1 [Macrostomum lignano]